MKTASLVLAALTLMVALAGCLGGDDLQEPSGKDGSGQDGPRHAADNDLFGWVVMGGSFQPVPDVTLSFVGATGNATTNETGFYGFPRLPRGEELVLIATHDAFETQPKRVLLPAEGSLRVNFTMEPKPVKTPTQKVLDFTGLLACQAVIEYGDPHAAQASGTRGADEEDGQREKVDCGQMDPSNRDTWEFSVGPDLAGIVVELTWEASTQLADFMLMTVEIPGLGGDSEVFAQVVGPNVLTAQINSRQASQYYPEGGRVKVQVEVDPNNHEQEQAVGVAFAYQQEFTIHATAFYVDPPPATYSVFD